MIKIFFRKCLLFPSRQLKGFTIIEVLASIVLLATALIPIMVIVPQMIDNSLKSEKLIKVLFLGEKKTEEVKREAINSFSVSRDEPVSTFVSPYGDYKYTVSDDEGADIKVIQVQVWYDEDGDNTRNHNEVFIVIDTKIANRG